MDGTTTTLRGRDVFAEEEVEVVAVREEVVVDPEGADLGAEAVPRAGQEDTKLRSFRTCFN